MTSYVIRSRVEAEIWTFGGFDGGRRIPLTDFIVNTTADKSLSEATGTMSIVVRWNERMGSLLSLVRDGDWLIMKSYGFRPYPRCRVGFVASVTRSDRIVASSGAPLRDYTLTFRDVGEPFEMHEFRTNSLLPKGIPGIVQVGLDIADLVARKEEWIPAKVLQGILRVTMRPPKIRKTKATPPGGKPPGPAPQAAPPAAAPLTEGQLSTNFHINEFISKKDLNAKPARSPDATQQANLKQLAGYLQIVRDEYLGGAAVKITPSGGWRSAQLQKEMNPSAPNSRHKLGKAADLVVPGKTPVEVATALSQAIAAERIPANYGVFLYSTFVHYDYGDSSDGGGGRPVWVAGTPTTPSLVPSAADVTAFLALKPVPGSATPIVSEDVASDADDATEGDSTKAAPPPEEPEFTVEEGQSGDGVYIVPGTLARLSAAAPGRPPGSGEPPRWDWLDVCDTTAYVDPYSRIRGRWWQLVSFLAVGKSKVDGFIRGQCDEGFNELFYDTRPAGLTSTSKLARFLGGWAPAVVYRRRPFDKPEWEALPACVIPPGIEVGESIAKGGAERFNYFYARPIGTGDISGPTYDEAVNGGEGLVPAIDVADIAVHGLRSLEVEAQFAFPSAQYDATQTLPAMVAEFTEALYRWYRPLPSLYGGSLTIPYAEADALIGNRVEWTSKKFGPMWAYIEGVSEVFNVNPDNRATTAQTNISISRGQPRGEYLEALLVPWK